MNHWVFDNIEKGRSYEMMPEGKRTPNRDTEGAEGSPAIAGPKPVVARSRPKDGSLPKKTNYLS